ncbi:MAG: hypothetical protein JO189_27505 [Deltaproteobacteria bacterium]|nr:hypothetical protein [Deltaproteobacteria bacterium]
MGRPGFTLTGEMLIFVSQLDEGIIPDAVVFIDGLNDSAQRDGVSGFGPILSPLIDRS